MEGKRSNSRRTDSCCTDEATRRRGKHLCKDGGEGKGNKWRDEAKSKNGEIMREDEIVLQAVIVTGDRIG